MHSYLEVTSCLSIPFPALLPRITIPVPLSIILSFRRFDDAKKAFEVISLLEGHLREVTRLLLACDNAYLWSASADHTLRVWEMASSKCLGVLSAGAGAGGHGDVVTSLVLVAASPPTHPDPYIASGSGDGEVKLWRPNGELVHTCSHSGEPQRTFNPHECHVFTAIYCAQGSSSLACRPSRMSWVDRVFSLLAC